MKQMAVFAVFLCLLSGCGKSDPSLDQVVALRQQILSSDQCQFEAEITADYGDKLFSFTAKCSTDSIGDVRFAISDPESIEGISGRISDDGGNLTFEDFALNFPLLAEGELSPVSAPWILMKTLRGGYLKSVGKEDNGLRLTIDDSYREDALTVDIWLDDSMQPVRADVLHNGSRILSLSIKNFHIL